MGGQTDRHWGAEYRELEIYRQWGTEDRELVTDRQSIAGQTDRQLEERQKVGIFS